MLPCWCGHRAGGGYRVGGVLATIREGSSPAGCGWWCACRLSDLPTFRLFDLSICWEVGGRRPKGRRGGVVGSGLPRDKRTRRAAGSGASAGGKPGWGCDELTTIRGPPVLGGWWRVPTCQLFDFPTFRLVGKSESWRLGDLAGCERWVVVVYRRGKASVQEGVRKCCRVWDV